MAKFTKADEEIQEMVNEIATELDLDNFIDFEALFVSKGRETVTVTKASAIAQYYAKRDDLVLLICKEDVFNAVDDKTKKMWLRMAMDTVSYDSEKGCINIGCPMITVPYGFYLKYKDEAINAAELSILTNKQIEDKKEQEKQDKKNKKNKKKE